MNATATNTRASDHTTTNPEASFDTQPKRLCRPIEDRMLAGVAVGLARYIGVDVTVVRIVLAALAFVGGAGVPIYVAGWLLIPEEGAERSFGSTLIQTLRGRSN